MTEQATENRKRYKYEDCLQFLAPYLSERDVVTNVSVQETSTVTEIIDDIQEPSQEEQSDAETNQPQISSSIATRIFQGRKKARRSQNSPTPLDTPSALLVKYILDKDDPQNVSQVLNHDDIDTFLMGIASTLKKLNPYNQHIAKGRIFNVVHELEAQEFFSQGPYSSSKSSRHSLDSDSRRSNDN